jgi:hypothetical protein
MMDDSSMMLRLVADDGQLMADNAYIVCRQQVALAFPSALPRQLNVLESFLIMPLLMSNITSDIILLVEVAWIFLELVQQLQGVI